MRRCFTFLVLASSLCAQPPVIYNRAVLNAASFMPPRLPGGAIAQGSLFSIFGARLGPSTPVQANSFPLGTTLGGVSITITQGSTTVNAIPVYVGPSQINAIMPSNAPVGTASMRVKNGNTQSNPMPVVIAPTAFGIFTATQTGLGPGILVDASQPNQPINSPAIAAQPGDVMVLYGTGLGPVPNDTVAPTSGNLPTKVEILVGGVPAMPLYSGRSACCSGLDQLNFQIPANAPQGCWVPVYVRTAGTVLSNVVTIAIGPNSSSCGQGLSYFNPGKYGGVVSIRVATHEDIGTKSTIDVIGDYASAIAYQVPGPASAFPFSPVLSLPPAGTCTAYAIKGDLLRGDTLPGAVPPGATPLNYGAGLTISGPGGLKMLQNILAASPLRYLGGSITNNLFPNTAFLQPGSYQVSNMTPGDVGSFSASANLPQPLTWTNRDQIVTVDRTQPLNVSWSGGSGTQVMIVGFGVDLPTDSTTVFGCVSPPGATSFTVPAIIMSNIPATRPNPLQSKSVIYLGNLPDVNSTATFTASGLNAGLIGFQYATGKTVIYQ